MKRIILIMTMFLMFIGNEVSGQSLWFQEGTTWVHLVSQINGGGFLETKLEKDTIIDGTPCKKFNRFYQVFDPLFPYPQITESSLPPIYMYASADNNAVYYYYNGAFKLIYNFNVEVGDLVKLPYNEVNGISELCPNNEFMVDSIGIEEIDGLNLKWFAVSQTTDSQHFYSGKIFQKIGSTSWYFTSLVDPPNCFGTVEDMNFITEFRCFSDNGFEFKDQYVIDVWEGNCYFPGEMPIIISLAELDEFKISLFPNPVENTLYIENNGNTRGRIEVIDIVGKKEMTLDLESKLNTVDLSTLTTGIYFLRFVSLDKVVKFIKK